ncbi:MAG: hypothetical protein EOP21_00340 [Hyphomicrobiales bacterium]|nr:MAG: hypothetical protein EOP21_00340 [Hyphomicrobiales bacterium]
MSQNFSILGFTWPYSLNEVLGWLFILAVIALYCVAFAFSRPKKLIWSLTAISALTIMIAIIRVSRS